MHLAILKVALRDSDDYILKPTRMARWLNLACSVQEESKTNAGSVEAIQEHPEDSNKVRTQLH